MLEQKEDKRVEESISPKTTKEEDINTASQRVINLIWERTQSRIAIMVVSTAMVSGLLTSIANLFYNKNDQVPTIVSVAFGTVIGFYFSRTNHSSIGGIGKKPIEPHVGR